MGGSPAPVRLPLTGRDDEIELVLGALREDTGVVLAGAAGVGKTRLAREALAALGGPTPVWVMATEAAASIPLAALAALVPPGDLGPDRLSLFRGMTAVLAAQFPGERPLLAVDDAHLLDPLSAAFVQHVATSGSARTVLTIRSGEPAPDAVSALWKDGYCRRIDLQALSEHEVVQLLDGALGGQVAAAVRHWGFTQSEGNPLVLHELLMTALEAGSLVQDRSMWRLVAAPPPGDRLTDLLRDRIGKLTPPQGQALELVALGEPLPIDALAALVDSGIVDQLERRAVITTEVVGSRQVARTSHPILGEVLRAGLPPGVATRLRGTLADALATAGDPGDAVRVTTWQLAAGRDISADRLLEAATEARRKFDPAAAERLAAAAVEAGGEAVAHIARAGALVVLGRHGEAAEVVADLAGDALPERLAGRLLLTRVMATGYGLGRIDDVLALLDDAAAWHPGPAWQRRVEVNRAGVYSYAGRFAEAVAVGLPLVEEAFDQGGRMPNVAAGVAIALLQIGRAGEAEALTVRLTAGAGGPAAAGQGDFLAWAGVRIVAGRGWAEVESVASQRHQRAVADDDAAGAGVAALALGNLALARGCASAAVRWLREAATAMETADARGLLLTSLGFLAHAEALAGTAPDSIRAWFAPLGEGRPGPWVDHMLVRADAWVTAAEGELTRAQRLALDGAAACGESLLNEASLLHSALRLGTKPADVAGRLDELEALTDSALAALFAAHARGLVARNGAALDSVSDAFDEMGAFLLAAEACADAAAIHRANGRAASARSAAARSAALAVRCDGARTPKLGPVAVGVTLSRREREVAGLAARDLSNAEIAERLTLSVRTVESHLYRAMSKLGVTRREDLGPLVGAPPPGAEEAVSGRSPAPTSRRTRPW